MSEPFYPICAYCSAAFGAPHATHCPDATPRPVFADEVRPDVFKDPDDPLKRDRNLGMPLAHEIAHRPDPKQPLKYDSAEAPVYQGAIWYFPMALNEVARVSAFGATKYNWNKGWLAGKDAFPRYSDALVRHLGKEAYEELDTGPKGSQLLHAAHVAWNALARLEVLLYARKGQQQLETANALTQPPARLVPRPIHDQPRTYVSAPGDGVTGD